MMHSLSPSEKRILRATAIVSLSALLFHFGLGPVWDAFRKLSMEIQVAEVRLQKARRLVKKASEIEEAFQKYAGALEKKGSPEEVMTGVLQEVEKLAQKNRLTILDMRPLPKREKAFFKEMGLEISAESTAPQLAQLIYDFLGSPYTLKIEKLELSSKPGESTLLKAIIVVTTLSR